MALGGSVSRRRDRFPLGEVGLIDHACNALEFVVSEPGERRIAFEEARDIHGSKYEPSQ
jgi:hypothetical protein